MGAHGSSVTVTVIVETAAVTPLMNYHPVRSLFLIGNAFLELVGVLFVVLSLKLPHFLLTVDLLAKNVAVLLG